jgi:hypothetical protein
VGLHITGDALYAQVAAALAAPGGGFRVVADQAHRNVSLVPSATLAGLCGPTASPLPAASCVLRYDVQARAPAAGLALEVVQRQTADTAKFMQGLLGESPYAAAVGSNFFSTHSGSVPPEPGWRQGKARILGQPGLLVGRFGGEGPILPLPPDRHRRPHQHRPCGQRSAPERAPRSVSPSPPQAPKLQSSSTV